MSRLLRSLWRRGDAEAEAWRSLEVELHLQQIPQMDLAHVAYTPWPEPADGGLILMVMGSRSPTHQVTAHTPSHRVAVHDELIVQQAGALVVRGVDGLPEGHLHPVREGLRLRGVGHHGPLPERRLVPPSSSAS